MLRSTFSVGTNVVYGRIQELGGIIKPTHGEFLVFEIDGEVIHARQVRIPAHPYLRPALDEKKEAAIATVGAVFSKLVIAKQII